MKRNKKNTETLNPFADTVQVRRICSGHTELKKPQPKNEKLKKRNEYSMKSQLPDYGRRKTTTNLDQTGLKYFLPETQKTERINGVPEKLKIPRQLKGAQLGSEIKMISVNLPRFGRGQAIISSNIKGELDNEKRQHIQTNKINDLSTNTSNFDQPSFLLEDAQKEIDISQTQLAEIQTILKNRHNEESYSLKPKWDSFSPKNISKVNSKERVIATLTSLNKKLNDMQEKYFGGTKTSMRDFSSKMEAQSVSEVDITESNNDRNVQIEDKEEILDKFHSSRMNLSTTQIAEENGTFIHKDIGDYEDILDRKQLHIPIAKKAMIDVTETNSDCFLPTDARNNTVQNFHLSKIKKNRDSFEQLENMNKYRQLSDKEQHFSTAIPDMILYGNESVSDITQSSVNNLESESFSELSNDFSESGFIQDFEDKYVFDEAKDVPYEEKDEDDLSGMKMEKLGKLPKEINVSSLKEQTSLVSKNLTSEITEVNALKSISSETAYFDCDSKSSGPYFTSNPSNKKIFYDNFGHYSNQLNMKNRENALVNSVPKLSSTSFNSCESITRGGKEIFYHTPLQNDVLKSDYLTRSFTVDSSGSLSENHPNSINKNNSDQDFNKGLDFQNLGSKNIDGSKMTRDMYYKLSKALTNSFYKLSPHN